MSSDTIRQIINNYSPYFKEIKRRLLFIFYTFLIGTLVGFGFYEDIIKFLIGSLSLKGVNIVFTSPFQFINLAISTGVATGLVVTFQLIIYQIMSFLKPALKDKEYKLITHYIPASLILFLVGFVFGAVIMKWQIEIFLDKSISLGIGNILDITGLLSTVILTSSIMGIGFQFPILLVILNKLGIVTKEDLKKQRRWVYLASFVFALLLPPDSIIADIILSLPLITLFELTIFTFRNKS